MLKFISIFATVAAVGLGVANAQQKQAMLRNQQQPLLTTMEVPGADFDIVICTIRPDEDVNCGQPRPRADQWQTRVFLVPKGEAFPSPEL